MTLNFLPLSSTSPYFMDAIKVYDEYIPSNQEYQIHFFRNHMRRPGYVGVLAQVDDVIAGFAFGSYSLVGQWWHDTVANHVGYEHPALQSAWVLTQFNVLEAYRNQSIGKTLLAETINQQTETNLLLSTQVANTGAQRFYKRLGWYVLHEGIVFSSGDEPYKILAKAVINE
ncbi:MAG: GNAT family N-acetyltransferase [Phototrophicaceae bacterium]